VESHHRAGRKSDSGEGRTEIINQKRDKKDLTAEHAEIAELVLGKDKKHKSLYGYGLLFAFPSSGDEDKRMNEGEAGSAKIASWNRFGRLGLPQRSANGAAVLLACWALSFLPFSPLRSLRLISLLGFVLHP
jgi:hypothetical protein